MHSPRVVALTASLLACATLLGTEPTFARRFALERRGDATLVTVNDAYPGAPDSTYLFVPRGTAVPDTRADILIRTPVERVVSLSTTMLPHFVDLGAVDSIVGVDSATFVYSPVIQRRVEAGSIVEVGSPPAADIEAIIGAAPDLVLLSVVTPDDPTVAHLRRAGIPFLAAADWREETPLGRAEWLIVIGGALERWDAARALFAERAAAYTALARTARGLEPRPDVLVNAPYRGTWAVPEGETYLARIIADAGGRYIWEDAAGSGSLFLDIEEVVARGATADVWINLGYGWRGRSDAIAADRRFAALEPYRSNAMFHYNRRVNDAGGNDYWESGASRPDIVLADLVSIFHPDAMPGYRRVYYRRLDP